MASSLIARRQDNKLIERLATLEEIVMSMRANQSQKLIFGNIIIDGTGTGGTITISDGTNIRVLIGYQNNGF